MNTETGGWDNGKENDLEVYGGGTVKCNVCPLFSSWNNESDRGESCGLFGDGWDSKFQYENKTGDVVGCYIDRHFIMKADAQYTKHLDEEVSSILDFLREEK